jgi:deoxyribonuclease-4
VRIGAHVGVGKGWERAAEYAADVGCECIQVFSKSPRMWRSTPLRADDVSAFGRRRAELGIDPVFVHTSYLINLGSDDEGLWRRSTAALAEELSRAAAVGASGVVTHVGTDPLGDAPRAVERIADAACAARQESASDVPLLLENTAGAGRSFGSTLEELAALLEALEVRDSGPTGICFDTCHAFAAGMDVTGHAGWERLSRDIHLTVGSERVPLVHANDCLYGRGEHRDRHAWIGDGNIGYEGFEAMMTQEWLSDAAVVLEMPGEAPEKDRVNVDRLIAIRDAR